MNSHAFLCSDHGVLEIDDAGLDVTPIPSLCEEPRRLLEHLGDDEVIVLGLSEGGFSLGEVQRTLRSAGFDPFGVPIIDLQEAATAERLYVALRGAVARANAFAGSGPQHAKAILPERFSRRDVLRLPQPEYLAAPEVDSGLCAAGDGCRACVDVCPQTAYRWDGARIVYDKSICEPCGLCVTTCPVGAISNPGATPGQIVAQIEAIVAAATGPVGIAFACRAAQPVVDSGWYAVEVPCVAMATPQWLLAPLLMGAGAVVARPCSDSGCPRNLDDRVASNIDYCVALLESLGLDADRVGSAPSDEIPLALDPLPLDDPFGAGQYPDLLTGLAIAAEVESVSLAVHPASPVAIVRIDPEACTACTMCAQTCPTGALDIVQDDGLIEIGFDAALCTACGQCVPRCPERERGAIALERCTDLASLQAGRSVLVAERSLVCESCGSPIASAPVMDRIASLLGPEQNGVMTIIGRLCIDCRGTS